MTDPAAPQTPPLSPAKSPLAEASADSLNDFFNRDPFEMVGICGRQTRDVIVAGLRSMRVRWEALEASGATKGKASVKDAATQRAVAEDLKALGLE